MRKKKVTLFMHKIERERENGERDLMVNEKNPCSCPTSHKCRTSWKEMGNQAINWPPIKKLSMEYLIGADKVIYACLFRINFNKSNIQ